MEIIKIHILYRCVGMILAINSMFNLNENARFLNGVWL